jgi:dTDP-4-amino-4,6-dideoxygalactose transaminase
MMAGARPVFADIDPDRMTIDPQAAAAAVTARTAAIMPVHLYGQAADMPAIVEVARQHNLAIVEDCCQAHSATCNGRPVGSDGAAAAYSFYPTKNLGGIGDGGAVVTDDSDLAAQIRLLRAHGLTGDYVHTAVTGNSRLSEIEAAALRLELRRLPEWNERRRLIAWSYREAAPEMRWQAPHERHVYHLCVARIEDRDAFRAQMPFGTAVHYPRALTQQPAYEQFVRDPCPEAESWAAECVSLPCFPEMTDEEIEIVCRALR